MTEEVVKKTVVREIIKKSSSIQQKMAFAAKPKLRPSISGDRCKEFMEHLHRKDFWECDYKALVIQFIQFFQTNDPRVIEKYLGRPQGRKMYPGLSIVRKNIRSGKAACFSYSNTRTIDPKTGLMELLGYLNMNKKTGSVTLDHESMDYCKEQQTLREFAEGRVQNFVVDDLCECLIEDSQDSGQGVVDRPTDTSVEGQARELVIEHTHKSGSLAAQPDEQERKQDS